MSGVITINFKVLKNGIADLGMKSPIYLPGPVEPHYGPGRYLTFEGFSVDQHGKQVCGIQLSLFPLTLTLTTHSIIWMLLWRTDRRSCVSFHQPAETSITDITLRLH